MNLRTVSVGIAMLFTGISSAAPTKIEFCQNAASELSRWVRDTRSKLKSSSDLEELQRMLRRTQRFDGTAQRLGARANTLVTTSLENNEVRADLYGLCMAVEPD